MMEDEIERLERYLKESLKDNKLSQILKYLIKGIVKYKDGDLEDSIHIFGKCIVLCQGHLVKVLITNYSKKKQIKEPSRGKPSFYFNTLYYTLFKDLKIKDLNIVSEARRIYTLRSEDEHKETTNKKHHPPRNKFPEIISNNIKHFLLVKFVRDYLTGLYNNFRFYQSKRDRAQYFTKRFQEDQISIEDSFTILFQKHSEEFNSKFIDLLFTTDIRNSLREGKIIKEKNIRSSPFLKKFFPLVPFSDYRIENILNSKDVIPFRPDGPHIEDFKSEKWIFIPQCARNIIELFKLKKYSILISAPSGYGKTVIARYLGYVYSKNSYKVFYFDFLNHGKLELKNFIDQIYYNNNLLNNSISLLFVFENIHILNKIIEKDILKKLDLIKDRLFCVFTRRIFQDQDSKLDLTFKKNQIVNLGRTSINFTLTIRGMIDKNAPNLRIASQLKNYNFGNLWVHAIILKTYNSILKNKEDLSLIEIFKDTKLIGDGIAKYFRQLLLSKNTEIIPYNNDDYRNGIKFLLAIISIFSEFELWVEKDFIKIIMNIDSPTPLGRLNKILNLEKEIFKDITSFLMKVHEIESIQIKYKEIFNKLEFRIPHSQMALIYKNCYLNTFESLFPGLINEIINLYILEGIHYGQFVYERSLTCLRTGIENNLRYFKEIYLSISKILGVESGFGNKVSKLKELILKNSITELNRFLLGFSNLTSINLKKRFKEFHNIDKEALKEFQELVLFDKAYFIKIIGKMFEDQRFLLDPSWKNKIKQTDTMQLDDFLHEIGDYLNAECCVRFIVEFKEEIFEKFKQFGGIYYLVLIINLINYPRETWNELFIEIQEQIKKSNPSYKELKNLGGDYYDFFSKFDKTHFIYPVFQMYIRNFIIHASLEEQMKILSDIMGHHRDFFPEIYLNYFKDYYFNSDLEDINFNSIFDDFIINNSLNNILAFLNRMTLYHNHLGDILLEKHQQIIKTKIESKEIKDVLDFFDGVFNSEMSPSVTETVFLVDWEWFRNLFINLELEDLSKVFNANRYVLNSMPNKYKNDLYELLASLTKQKIQRHYENLEDKVKIYELLDKDNKTYYIDEKYDNEILSIFRDEINTSLEHQKLRYYNNIFKKIDSQIFLNENTKKIWDIEKFILNIKFQGIVLDSEINEINEFFIVILEQFYPIAKKVVKTYNALLTKELNVEIFVEIAIPENFNTETKNVLIALKEKDFTKFCILCNSYVGKYEIYGVPLIHFTNNLPNIKEIVLISKNKFFLDEMKDFLLEMHPFHIFNFLIILFKLNETFYHEFLIAFYEVIKEKLQVIQLHEALITKLTAILGIYHLPLSFLSKLDELLNLDFSLMSEFLNGLNSLDILTFRVLSMRFPHTFKENINLCDFNKILNNSSLTQIALGLVNYHAQLSIINPPNPYVLYNPRLLFEVDSIIFERLTKHIKTFIKNNILELERMNEIEVEYYIKNFEFFSGFMLEKLKNAPLNELIFYFRTVNTWGEYLENTGIIPLSNEFIKYLNSGSFNDKFLNLTIPEMFKFTTSITPNLRNLPLKLYKENQDLFLSEDYITNLTPYSFMIVFSFYTVLQENIELLTNTHIKFLKEKLLESNFYTLISLFKSASEEKINFLFGAFMGELEEVIRNSSRSEIWVSLGNYFHIQTDIDSFISWLVENFPFFNEKLNERYFFDL